MFIKNILLIVLCCFYFSKSFASAWTREKGQIYLEFENLVESDYFNKILRDINKTNYKIKSNKIYLEYGVFDSITLGGYLKKYNFEYNFLYNDVFYKKEVNDYYSNIFIINNFYKNKNLFSFEVSFYLPLNVSKDSKNFNIFETENSYEFSLLYGTDRKFYINSRKVMFFINTKVGYRIFNNINYDRINFENTIGFRLNKTSAFIFEYNYQNHIKSNILKSNSNLYDKNSDYILNQIQFSLNYKFLDRFSTEISYFKKFSNKNSLGFILSFIFEY